MKLIVGLGNPGREYAETRHNTGFTAVDLLAKKYRMSFSSETKLFSEVAVGNICCEKVVLVKPKTFMNESGKAVVAVKNYYKESSVENIWVVHDDADFEFGRIKIQIDGGTAGHNGLNSIIQFLGETNFVRFRVGIGRPINSNIPLEDYVLQKFSETEDMTPIIERVVNAVEQALEKGLDHAMNIINR